MLRPMRGKRRCVGRGAALLLAAVIGCSSSTTRLDPVVVAYDTTTANSIAKLLLLNIARARHNLPMHFTTISSIVATYKFSVSGGVTPAATGERGYLPVPYIGGSSEENPTVSISPMSGEEFTQRLLTPFQEQKLTLLLRQGYDVDALFRLLGAEMRMDGPDAKISVHRNRPSDGEGYRMFRRVVAHLSSIQDRHALHVEPLHYQQAWKVPVEQITPEAFETTYKEFSVTRDPASPTFSVTRRVNGRVMISNYDPSVLTNEERALLHAQADEAPYNDILIDIRAGFPGGELPLHGRLRLRSFHEVLTFIGRGITEEPEFDVKPDPRTPPIAENPVRTLDIVEAKSLPSGSGISIALNGTRYAVRPQKGYQWNQKVFSLLYQLYQMSVSTVENTGPAITIAK